MQKDKLNIWIIHPYSGSPSNGMSFRPYYLAKYFNEQNYKTIIISSFFHHLSDIENKEIGSNKIEGIDYFLVKVPTYKGNGLRRVLNMLSFGYNLFRKDFYNFACSNKPTAIIASTAHPFHFLAAKYYSKKFNAKLILEVRDLLPLSLQELLGVSKFNPISILLEVFQNYAYKNCDHCVSLLEHAEPYLLMKGLKKNSFSYIPNGIEVESSTLTNDCNALTDLKKTKKNLGSNGLIIGYMGAIGKPNNIDTLIKSMSSLKKLQIVTVIFGEGTEKKRLLNYKRKNKLDNVKFFDPIPKAQIAKVIKLCDLMFINAQPKKIYKYGISPNKIFDYLLQDKYTLSGIDSPGNPLELASAEIYFQANDDRDLARKILDFYYNRPTENVNFSKFVRENYSYKCLSKKYIELIQELKFS